jgi:hypothetical protein
MKQMQVLGLRKPQKRLAPLRMTFYSAAFQFGAIGADGPFGKPQTHAVSISFTALKIVLSD